MGRATRASGGTRTPRVAAEAARELGKHASSRRGKFGPRASGKARGRGLGSTIVFPTQGVLATPSSHAA